MNPAKKLTFLTALLMTLSVMLACGQSARESQTPTNPKNKLTLPHPAQWARPDAHGETFAKADSSQKALCMSCHIPVNGVSKAISCYNCHKAYPHDTPENQGIKEGMHKDQAKSFAGKCLNCHVGYTKNISMETGCRTCHEGSLVIGWSTKPEDQRKPNGIDHQLKPKK